MEVGALFIALSSRDLRSPSAPGNSAARHGDGPRDATHPLAVLVRGQCPSSRGPPRHHWTKWREGILRCLESVLARTRNLPAVVRGSPESAAVRGKSRPA